MILLYFKSHLTYLLGLLLVFVAPLVFLLGFSTYEVPKVSYASLIVLFISQYLFYKENDFHRKIEQRVALSLEEEFRRTPSKKEIRARSRLFTQFRSFSIIMTALSIVAVMIYFQEF